MGIKKPCWVCGALGNWKKPKRLGVRGKLLWGAPDVATCRLCSANRALTTEEQVAVPGLVQIIRIMRMAVVLVDGRMVGRYREGIVYQAESRRAVPGLDLIFAMSPRSNTYDVAYCAPGILFVRLKEEEAR